MTDAGEQQSRAIAPRAHKKSRNGCRTCKERKIKCDETHPLCVNCKIYYQGSKNACEYEHPTRPTAASSSNGESSRNTERRLMRRPTEVAGASSTQTTVSLPIAIAEGSLDPFESHPPTVERNVDTLIKHYFSTCVFNMFPWNPAPGKNPQTKYYAPIVYSDPVLFHVTLQLSALHLEKLEARRDLRQSKQLMAECLRLLRERIETSSVSGEAVSDQTISAVAGLAAIEHEKGNVRMVRMHMDGLKRMADLRGGLNGLRQSNAMVANIVFCMFVAAVDEEFPVCDLLFGIQKPPWYPEASKRFDDTYYARFQDFDVHEDFASCLRDIRLLAASYPTANDCEDAETYLSVLSLLCSTLQRIMSMPSVGLPRSYVFWMAEACRSAAAVHVFSQWKGHQPDPTLMVSKAQHSLRLALSNLMIPGAGNPVLLWLLTAGAVGALGSPERTWYVGHLAAMVQELSVTTFEQLKDGLKRVMWHELQDDPTHRVLWDEVIVRIEEMDA